MSVTLNVNEELNGIELFFDNKPSKEIRSKLKANRFRYSGPKNCWYAKQNDQTFKVAEELTQNKVIEQTKTEKKPVKKNSSKQSKLSLWDATQWNEINSDNKQDTKLIAKEIRQHLRKRFPQCKFSVTSDYNHIYVIVKQSPFNTDSVYLGHIREYCNNLVNAYKVCYREGDPYTDLPSSYNFYFFNTTIDYDYIQTEQTEEIKKDMENFDIKLKEFEDAEEERKEKEFQEYLKEQEQRDIEYKKQREEEQKQIDNIYNNVNVKSLNDNDQYFIINAEFAHLNKNNTLNQYKDEVNSGKYSLENVKVIKEIHFNNVESLQYFSNALLSDFDFLEGAGGSYTDDNRINSMTDFYNMDDEERKSVQWNLKGAAIYLNNELQYVVDTQGYNYARYVGLTSNATIQKSYTFDQVVNDEELKELKNQADQLEEMSSNVIQDLNIIDSWQNEKWDIYKDNIKEKLKLHQFKLTKGIIQQLGIEELKTSMYKLLQEVDGIQDQFNDADLKQGDKITLFYISDWGSIITSRVTLDSVENTKYAQYDNAVKLTFKPENKRKLHYNYFYSTLLVFKGWHTLPENVLNEVEHKNGMRIIKSKYHSCDKKQYDEILNHFNQQDIQPIINTYKPIL